jgi:glycosyltransferase involved in cell wall biosynthesis
LRLLLISDASSLHTKRWAEWFAGRGHQVLLASLEEPRDITVPFRKLPGRSGWRDYLAAAPPLRKIIGEYKPDLVNAHYVPSYGLLGRLAGFRPLAVSAWGSDLLVSAKRSMLHRMRARLALARAVLATCDGRNLEEELVGLGVVRARILNLPLGVDRGLILDRPPSLDCRRLYSIVSTRSLEPVYDVGTMIRAMPRVAGEAGRPVRLTIVGDGKLRPELERLARESGAEKHISFTGRLEHGDLMAELDRSGIYVSASLSDSTSVSLLEAMARGLAPVASDIPGNRDWIEDGANGLLFRPGDHDGLARRLSDVLGGRVDVKKFSQKNLELVRARGCRQRNMERIEDAFLKLTS